MSRRRRQAFPKSVRDAVAAKTNGRCCNCGCELEDGFWIQHIIPWSHGGSDDLSNLIAACPHCNRLRSNGSPEELREIFGIGYALFFEIRRGSPIGRDVTAFLQRRERRLGRKRRGKFG